jgi:hypothetical protein
MADVEVMSIAVTEDDQWLVANARPIEYYAGDTAFVEGQKVWAAEQAARRLADALGTEPVSVDFVTGGFPDAVVTLPNGERLLVHGALLLKELGVKAEEPSDISEEELIILARELVDRARSRGEGVEPAPADAVASA